MNFEDSNNYIRQKADENKDNFILKKINSIEELIEGPKSETIIQKSQALNSKFQIVPKEKKEGDFKEAKELRSWLLLMMILHIAFILVEIFVYSFRIGWLWELTYIFACYWAYMTLNICLLYSYVFVLASSGFFGIFNVFHIFFTFSLLGFVLFPL